MTRSAVVGLLVTLGATGPAAAEPRDCPPAARVEGDPALVEPISRQLADAGVGAATGDCPWMRAEVERSDGGIAVVVHDGEGRADRRQLADVDIAATWIESRLGSDLSAPLLAPRIDVERSAPRASAASDPGFSLAIDTRSMAGGDGSTWRTLGGSVCARLGWACVGLAAEVGDNRGFSTNDGLTRARRRAIDVQATIRAPVRVGRATLAPSAGVGAVWMRTGRDEPDEQSWNPDCQPDDPSVPCDPLPPMVIGDGFTVSDLHLRARLALSLSVPIADLFALEVGAGIDLTPGAHAQPFAPPPPDDNTDPTMPPPPEDPILELPGEPGHLVWWGIGLRLGAP